MDPWEEKREVFARFGLAAYHAQCLEYELISLLLLLERAKMPTVELDSLFSSQESLSKRTLGQLIRQLKSRLTLDAKYEEVLAVALEKRNFLMHHFFYHHAYDLPSEEGCVSMLVELDDISSTISECDNLMQVVTAMLARVCGISEKAIQELLERHGVRELP